MFAYKVKNFQMGAISSIKVKVVYRRTRAGTEAGAEITEPIDFFNEIFDENGFSFYQEHFEKLTSEQKARFLAVFDNQVDMKVSATGNFWLGNNEENEDFLKEKMNEINEILNDI